MEKCRSLLYTREFKRSYYYIIQMYRINAIDPVVSFTMHHWSSGTCVGSCWWRIHRRLLSRRSAALKQYKIVIAFSDGSKSSRSHSQRSSGSNSACLCKLSSFLLAPPSLFASICALRNISRPIPGCVGGGGGGRDGYPLPRRLPPIGKPTRLLSNEPQRHTIGVLRFGSFPYLRFRERTANKFRMSPASYNTSSSFIRNLLDIFSNVWNLPSAIYK